MGGMNRLQTGALGNLAIKSSVDHFLCRLIHNIIYGRASIKVFILSIDTELTQKRYTRFLGDQISGKQRELRQRNLYCGRFHDTAWQLQEQPLDRTHDFLGMNMIKSAKMECARRAW